MASTKDVAGTHWTGLWREGDHIAYFDSFGMPPPMGIIRLIGHTCDGYLYNIEDIQTLRSGHCGSYVMEFLQHMHEHAGTLKKRFLDYVKQFDGVTPSKNIAILRILEKD
jgi:hypothetical protein